ncbi:uncharacterized protein [Macaca nemestrina]|uniref:uncharacterized protein isoform X5 n=1 Tax=Macaca nemestrina TaxID=9545 RepID=UPI0039B90130
MTLHCLKVCSTFPFSLPPALAMEDLPAFPSPSAMTIESRLLLEGCFSSSGISVDLRTIQHEKMEPTNFVAGFHQSGLDLPQMLDFRFLASGTDFIPSHSQRFFCSLPSILNIIL